MAWSQRTSATPRGRPAPPRDGRAPWRGGNCARRAFDRTTASSDSGSSLRAPASTALRTRLAARDGRLPAPQTVARLRIAIRANLSPRGRVVLPTIVPLITPYSHREFSRLPLAMTAWLGNSDGAPIGGGHGSWRAGPATAGLSRRCRSTWTAPTVMTTAAIARSQCLPGLRPRSALASTMCS